MTVKVNDFRLSPLGKELKPVKAARVLGVILNTNLTFNEHIVFTVSSCMSRLGQINVGDARKILPGDLRLYMAYCMVSLPRSLTRFRVF